jgi:hypothetical protein
MPIVSRILKQVRKGGVFYCAWDDKVYSDRQQFDVAFLRECIAERLESMRRLVRANAKSFAGSFYSVRLDMKRKKGRWAWIFRTCLLAVLRDGEMPFLVPKHWKKVKVVDPKPYAMCRFVARALRYPTGLLLGPPEMALRAMQAIGGLKTRGTSGCFRKTDTRTESAASKDHDGTQPAHGPAGGAGGGGR